jgi:beta-lactamase regulating signal transducer with metallopeptidase domain
MTWLFDTLVWTAALLALVLATRRTVARHFGPQASYALWALPFVRLLLPPIELPAWLAPAPPATAAAAPATAPAEFSYVAVDVAPAPTVAHTAAATSFDWLLLVLGLWLAGAAVFLLLRFSAYFRMRRELLARARPVGNCGRVRLVETPEVASPLAFGVLDKVVALPAHFMARYDRHARDLALEHELAHHRGHDLLVNFAVQPLFALHWFNPLSWLGWRAMRRDQEAACDARVIAARGSGERAAYASLIAEVAAGPRIALAAPMACPVLGDKSIVHRLRSLAMSDISRRRRLAGRALLGAAVLALPLTASVTYAEIPPAPEAPEAPLPPPAPADVPAAALAPEAPEAPVPPIPPEAPRAADGTRIMIVRTRDGDKGEHEIKKVVRDGEVVFFSDGRELSEEEFEAKMEAMGARLEGLGEELELKLENLPRIDEKRIRVIERGAERLAALAPEVRMNCDGASGTSETTTPDGRRVIRICESRIRADAVAHANAGAVAGLKRARDQIARNTEMSEKVRREVVRELDREISRIEKED